MTESDSIVDMLDRNITSAKAETSDGEEIFVPRKCAYCKSNVICSVLPTFIGISKIGILIGVEECPFYIPGKTDQTQQE
jgi:hypothetical protein